MGTVGGERVGNPARCALINILLFPLIAAAANYTYDTAGRLVKIDYGPGGIVTYNYDSIGNLTGRQVSPAAPVRTQQSISFASFPNVNVGAAPLTLGATATSGLAVTYTSNTPTICTVSGPSVTITKAGGGCSITASQPGNTQYAAANPVTQQFTVLFADVSPADYYATAVNLFAQRGITSGCGNDGYCPLQSAARDQMAIFLVRAVYGGDNFTSSPNPYFTDVQSSTFGFKWIQKLYELGITRGCTATTYCPTLAVSRDQMAIFLIRLRYGLLLTGTPPAFTYPAAPYFTDVVPAHPAFPWIQRLKMDNITNGCSATNYCPNFPVTRGDMAIFILRAAFNQFLPAGTPVLTGIVPATLKAGVTASFTITGSNTHFVQGTTAISAISGVSIGPVTVNSPTSLSVDLTAAVSAPMRPESILAITGTEQAVLPNGLAIK